MSTVEVIASFNVFVTPAELGSKSYVEVTMTTGTEFTYYIDYGDTTIISTDYREISDVPVLEHQYASSGAATYAIHAYVENRRSSLSINTCATVDVNITDLSLTYDHTVFTQQSSLVFTASAGTRINIFCLLGDDAAIETLFSTEADLSPIYYTYLEKGIYSVECWVTNPLYFQVYTFTLGVNIEITDLNVVPVTPYMNLTDAFHLVRTLTTGSHVTCYVDYGDGYEDVTYEVDAAVSMTYSRTYQAVGQYCWNVTCYNYLEQFQFDGCAFVQRPITNFNTDQLLLLTYGDDLTITWTLDLGTEVDFTLEIGLNGEAGVMVSYHQVAYVHQATSGSAVLRYGVEITECGDWVVRIHGQNLVHYIDVNVNVITRSAISDVTTILDVVPYAEPTHEVVYTVSLVCCFVTLCVNFDGAVNECNETFKTSPNGSYVIQLTHSFPDPGYYTSSVNISTANSWLLMTHDIGIEYTAKDCLELTYVNTSDPLVPVEFTITLTCLNAPNSALINWTYNHDAEVTIGDPFILDSVNTYVHNHIFPYYMYYNVSLCVWNNVSVVCWDIVVLCGIPISGAEVILEKECVEVNIAANFTVNLIEGTVVSYWLIYGDGAIDNRTRPGEWSSSDYFTHFYTTPGLYEVKLSTVNNISSMDAYANQTIQIALWVVTLEKFPTQMLIGDNASTQFNFSLTFGDGPPTDALCNFTYADNRLNYSVFFDMDSGAFIHPHIHSIHPGPATVDVVCSNCVSARVFNEPILFHRVIGDVTVALHYQYVETHHLGHVKVTTASGSHINYTVVCLPFMAEGYADMPVIEEPDYTMNLSLNFTVPGNYSCYVTCFNDVSLQTKPIDQRFVVQNPIPEMLLNTTAPAPYPPGDVTFSLTQAAQGPSPTDPFTSWSMYENASAISVFAGSITTTVSFSYNYRYTKNLTFPHTVFVNVSNHVSYRIFNVTIEVQQLIYTVVVAKHSVCIQVSDALDFNVSVTHGSSATAYFFKDDGYVSKEAFLYIPDATLSPVSFPSVVFDVVGNSTIQFDVNNTVSENTTGSRVISVNYPVPEVTVTCDEYVEHPPGVLNCTVSLANLGDPGPTNTFVNLTLVEHGLTSLTDATSLEDGLPTSCFIQANDTVLDLVTLRLWVYNCVSEQMVNLTTFFEIRITGLRVVATEAVVDISHYAEFTITLLTGSHTCFNVDFDASNSSSIVSHYCHPNQLNSTTAFGVTHRYHAAGTYSLDVGAYNHVSFLQTETNVSIVVMVPVESDSVMLTMARFIKVPPGIVNITLEVDEQFPSPTHISIVLSLSDGAILSVNLDEFRTYTFQYVVASNTTATTLTAYAHVYNMISNVTVSNWTFIVCDIEELEVFTNKSVYRTGEDVAYGVVIAGGSNITLMSDFGDTNKSNVLLSEGCETPVIVAYIVHAYGTEGNYTANFTAINPVGIGSDILDSGVLIQIPILEDFTRVTCPEVVANPPGNSTFTVVFLEGRTPPTVAWVRLVTSTVSYEDRSYSNGPITVPLIFAPDQYGNSPVNVTVSNLVSQVTANCTFEIQVPITNVTAVVQGQGTEGILPHIQYHLHVNTSFYLYVYTDGSHREERIDFGDGVLYTDFHVLIPEGPVSPTLHTYSIPGMYTIIVAINNEVSQRSAIINVTVEQPVGEMAIAAFPSPVVLTGEPVSLTLAFPIPPSSPTIEFIWGDMTSNLTYSLDEHIGHIYESVGTYNISVIVSNPLSSATRSVQLTVCDAISGLTLLSCDDSKCETGTVRRFNLGSSITFSASVTAGTCPGYLQYLFVFPTSMESAMDGSPIQKTFPSVGHYIVTLRASNSVSSSELTSTVWIQSGAAAGIIIEHPVLPKVNASVLVELNFTNVPQHVALDIIFIHSTTVIRLCRFTMTSLCPTATFQSMDPIDEHVTVDEFSQALSEEGLWILNITFYSPEFDSWTYSRNINVQGLVCLIPTISNHGWATTQFTHGDTINLNQPDLFNISQVECDFTLENEFHWSVNEGNCIDALLGESTRNLVIEAREKTYGSYCANMSMRRYFGDFHYTLTGEFRFSIVPRPLTVRINDGVLLYLGKAVTQEIHAVITDIDNDDNPQDLKWYCRREGEEISENPVTIPQTESVGNNADGQQSGCFGTGPGLLDFVGGTFTLYTSNMVMEQLYIIELFVTKGSRLANASIKVEVVSGNPPSVRLVCKSCKQGKILEIGESWAVCIDCLTCAANPSISWTVVGLLPSGAQSQTQPSYVLSDGQDCVMVTSSAQLTNYEITVETTSPGQTKGKAEDVFCTPDIPHGGSFSVAPSTGEASRTLFELRLTDWKDNSPDPSSCRPSPSPLSFRYRRKRTESWEDFRLLPGLRARFSQGDNTLVQVIITNAYGKSVSQDYSMRVTRFQGDPLLYANSLQSDNPADGIAALATIVDGGEDEFDSAEAERRNKAIVVKMSDFLWPPKPVSPNGLVTMASLLASTVNELTKGTSSVSVSPILVYFSKLMSEAGEFNFVVGDAISSMIGDTVKSIGDNNVAVEEPVEDPNLEVDEALDFIRSEKEKAEKEQRLEQGRRTSEEVVESAENVAKLRSDSHGFNEPWNLTLEHVQMAGIQAFLESIEGKTFKTEHSSVSLSEVPAERSKSYVLILTYFPDNPFIYVVSAREVTTGVTRLSFTEKLSGKPVEFDDQQSSLIMVQKSLDAKDNWANMENSTLDQETCMIYIYVAVGQANSAFIMELYFDDTIRFEVYVKFNASDAILDRPNTTDGTYDLKFNVPDERKALFWILVIPEKYIFPPGIYIGLLPKGCGDPVPLNVTPAVSILSALSRCRAWNNEEQFWGSEYCSVGDDSTVTDTKCRCNTLTQNVRAYSGGIEVPKINAIDFSKIFSNFGALLSSNPTGLATVLAILAVYVLLLAWARRKDKQDLIMWEILPLLDDCKYRRWYKISVYTGMRWGAGTNSNVYFILAGENGDTGIRRLDDGSGQPFARGTVRCFMMSCERALEPWTWCRIWHDNSKDGWFLSKITVQLMTETGTRGDSGLHAGEKYFFMCDRWLSVEEDDGEVERILPCAGKEEVHSVEHVFKSKVWEDLPDDHLWLSVVSRPSKSYFTRTQRLTCCIMLITTTMVVNAMWYNVGGEPSGDQVIRLGSLAFSVNTILISIFATLIVIPPNLIVVQLFRRSRPRHYDTDGSRRQQPYQGGVNGPDATITDTLFATDKRALKASEGPESGGEPGSNAVGGITKANQKKKKKRKYLLPWWCIYVAWALAVVSILVSCAFVLFYTLDWGKDKSEEWLGALVLSFFQSVIVIQPLKVVALAMVISCIFKKLDDEDDDPDDPNNARPAADESLLDPFREIDRLTFLSVPKKPSRKKLEEARRRAESERRMWATVKEVVVYLLFLLLVAFIAWGPRNGNAFNMCTSIKNMLNGAEQSHNVENHYTARFLSDGFKFWGWLKHTVIGSLYYVRRYNGNPSKRSDRNYLSDTVSFRVGSPRLRQLRVMPACCDVQPQLRDYIPECNTNYNFLCAEDRNFRSGWFYDNISAPVDPLDEYFKYHSVLDLSGVPILGLFSVYGGGGYVVLLGSSAYQAGRILDSLDAVSWIDYYTRAVFLEFTVYNPNANLFAHVSYLVEFPSTGGVLPMPTAKCFQVYSALGGMGTAVLAAQIIYILILIYSVYREGKKLRQEKMAYFNQFWNVYEVVLIVVSIVCVAMYGLKEVFGRVITKQLKDNKDEYSSYVQFATYTQLVDNTVGAIIFLANIKFLRLLRFNSHISQLSATFRSAARDLVYFAAVFTIVFGAFTSCAVLLFGVHLYGYSDVLHAIQSLYAIMVGKVDFEGIRYAQPVLGQLFFVLFLLFVYFILVNMFVSIITAAYSRVRLNPRMASADQDVVSTIISMVKKAMCMQKVQKDAGVEFTRPVDQLEHQIEVINKMVNAVYYAEATGQHKPMPTDSATDPAKSNTSAKKSNLVEMFRF